MNDPQQLRDLALLDALGETTPEQKQQLVTALRSHPELAAEHASLLQLSSQLTMNAAALPALPDQLRASLEAKRSSVPRSSSRNTARIWIALAACLAILAAVGKWMSDTKTNEAPNLAQQSPPPDNVDQPMPMEIKAPPQAQIEGRAPSGTRRALLVGVECWPDKEKDPNRGAGWADLQMMHKVLTSKWGFTESNIHQVFNKEATLKNIVAAFEKYLITETKPGDSVVIYWSSHGTQVKDLDGDEPDGLDEAYCTFDFDWSEPETWFTDDLFAALLERIRTRDILVITDACHSGGSTRGAGDEDGPMPKAISSGFQPAKNINPSAKPHAEPTHVMLLAACASDEISYGEYGKGGHFTMTLYEVLMGASKDALSFQQAVERVRPKLNGVFKSWTLKPDSPKTWTPQFEGPVTKKIATFLNPPPPPPEPTPPLPIWQKQSGDIALNLTTDKTIYTEGDLMQVTVTPDLDCHLRLYYLSADHAVNQIFPNKFQPDGFVKRGQPVTLPGAAGTFEFRMSAPFGNEILMAVASSVPFTDQAGQDVQTQLFQEFKDTNLDALAHRGISVDEKKALTGRALHLYRVEAKK